MTVRVLPAGGFWNRQPLAYAPIQAHLAGRVEVVDDARDAQIVVFAHSFDLARDGRAIARMMARRPGLRAALLSEEPFWDSCWAEDPFSARQSRALGGGTVLPYAVINHHTEPAFAGDRLPYFPLTDRRFAARYAALFDRNAGVAAEDWVRRWREAEIDAAFVAERRTHRRHSPAWPERRVWGLSVFRSRLARDCRGARVLRMGRGWSHEIPRQEMRDWHAAKLRELDLRCRYVSGIENTHQKAYVTEKIYDAFAVGAVPLYAADADHDVRRLIGPEGWVNVFDRLGVDGPWAVEGFSGMPPFDATRTPDLAFAEGYARVQERLARLWTDPAAVEAERARLADALAARLRDLAGAPIEEDRACA